MSKTTLKPCPFCGGRAKTIKHIGTTRVFWTAYCTRCQVRQFRGNESDGYLYESEGKAVEAWNTRKPLDDIIRELEEEESTAQMYTGEYEDYDEYHHGQAVAFGVALDKLQAKETPTT